MINSLANAKSSLQIRIKEKEATAAKSNIEVYEMIYKIKAMWENFWKNYMKESLHY